METHRNHNNNSPSGEPRQGNNAPQGFEGMNFEEQRGSENSSDSAGVNWDGQQTSSNGGSTSEQNER